MLQIIVGAILVVFSIFGIFSVGIRDVSFATVVIIILDIIILLLGDILIINGFKNL